MHDSKVRYAALVFGLSLFLGGCSLSKYFQNAGTPDDNAITSAIQAKLFQDSTLKTQDIHVVSQKGVVVLTGTVGTDAEKSSAEQLANGVSGVKQVIDEMTVAAAAPPVATASPQAAPPQMPPPERPRRVSSRRHRAEESAQASAPAAPATAPASDNSQAQAQPQAPAPPPAPEAPPAPVNVNVPAGTVISIQTIDNIDSSKAHAGDEFAASVSAPVVVNGTVVIPQGSDARLRAVTVTSAGHIQGQSQVKLQLVSLSVGGASYPLETTSYSKEGASRGKRSAETIGGGAGLGALIGAIAGHGKGAAIGAAIGAGAGTAAQEATKGQQVVIPPESRIDFTLSGPITIPVQP